MALVYTQIRNIRESKEQSASNRIAEVDVSLTDLFDTALAKNLKVDGDSSMRIMAIQAQLAVARAIQENTSVLEELRRQGPRL